VQLYYSTNNVSTRLAKLTLAMFVDPKAPHAGFPLSHTKGKETEYLCLALEEVWAEHCVPNDPMDISVAAVLRHLATIYGFARKPQDGSAFQLTAPQWEELETSVEQLLRHYNALSNYASARGELLWNVTVKHHVMWHWGQQARSLHPSITACYIDEHFCGVVANILKASTGGRRIERVGETLMLKWQAAIILRWTRESAGAPPAYQ
jgi:hypothetical protein